MLLQAEEKERKRKGKPPEKDRKKLTWPSQNSMQSIIGDRPSRQMSQKAHLSDQFFSFKSLTPGERPVSVATEFIDVDWDEDEDEEIVSEIEEDDECEISPRTSLNSVGDPLQPPCKQEDAG